jgi:hypothetical protein
MDRRTFDTPGPIVRSHVLFRHRQSNASLQAASARDQSVRFRHTERVGDSSIATRPEQDRHRLNRSGDRQLNSALFVVALSRTRIHQPPATTGTDGAPRARPTARSDAASSATSHAESGASSSTHQCSKSPLDRHRRLARLGPKAVVVGS